MRWRVLYWLGSCTTEKIVEAESEDEAREKIAPLEIVNVQKIEE